jgi:hypothetical protein
MTNARSSCPACEIVQSSEILDRVFVPDSLKGAQRLAADEDREPQLA